MTTRASRESAFIGALLRSRSGPCTSRAMSTPCSFASSSTRLQQLLVDRAAAREDPQRAAVGVAHAGDAVFGIEKKDPVVGGAAVRKPQLQLRVHAGIAHRDEPAVDLTVAARRAETATVLDCNRSVFFLRINRLRALAVLFGLRLDRWRMRSNSAPNLMRGPGMQARLPRSSAGNP